MNFATAIIQLPLVRETGHKELIRSPADMARLCADVRGLAQESFHVILLNAKNRVVNRHMVSLGIADASLVHPREVFRQAIVDNAASMVLLHNHPSGDPTPSAEDIRITRQLIEVGKVVDIKILDHVIMGQESEGRPGFLSMRESGLCQFQ